MKNTVTKEFLIKNHSLIRGILEKAIKDSVLFEISGIYFTSLECGQYDGYMKCQGEWHETKESFSDVSLMYHVFNDYLILYDYWKKPCYMLNLKSLLTRKDDDVYVK